MRTGATFSFQTRMPAPRQVPTQEVNWPEPQDIRNQIQQIKVAALSAHPTVKQPVSLPTTPLAVNGVRVTRQITSASTRQVTVQFGHNTQDSYFQGVNVYLQTKTGVPALVASAPRSPVSFTAPKTAASSTVIVQSVGNSNSLAISRSPAKAVKLG